jgi:hypothetical protein
MTTRFEMHCGVAGRGTPVVSPTDAYLRREEHAPALIYAVFTEDIPVERGALLEDHTVAVIAMEPDTARALVGQVREALARFDAGLPGIEAEELGDELAEEEPAHA